MLTQAFDPGSVINIKVRRLFIVNLIISFQREEYKIEKFKIGKQENYQISTDFIWSTVISGLCIHIACQAGSGESEMSP